MNEFLINSIGKGIGLGFYLNKPNKKGYGVIYARYMIEGKRYRVSTSLSVSVDCWNKKEGRIIMNTKLSRRERDYHFNINDKINLITDTTERKLEFYLCDSKSFVDFGTIGTEIAKIISINKMGNKKAQQPLITLFKSIANSKDNPKTITTYMGLISTFKKFLDEEGIEDNVCNLTMSTIRKYREWLVKQDITITRAKDCLDSVFMFANFLERKHDFNFNLNKKQIEPITDKRTEQEKNDNHIALTHEEIERLEGLSVEGNLLHARDMFLLQCKTGVRVEDLPLLLSSKNIKKDENEVVWSVFVTQKRGILAKIPLNAKGFYNSWEIIDKYIDNCPYISRTDHKRYNDGIKEVCRLAHLDREITKTHIVGGKKVKETMPLYEVITSHVGRHSFVTNCQRYFNLPQDKIILMSGHKDTKIVQNIYTNTSLDDDKRMLLDSFIKPQQSQPKEEKPSRNNNYLIEGMEEAFQVAKYLGIHINESMTFDEIITEIEKRQTKLFEIVGVDIDELKTIFNFSKPLKARVAALKGLVSVLI